MANRSRQPCAIALPTPYGRYSNYEQPVQLIWRMLTSGNYAAISALLRESGKLVVYPLDWWLERFESKLLQQDHLSTEPIILVIGAPRSGTTLIHQTIAKCCNVSYFANVTDLFPRAPITATRLFSPHFGKQKTDFKSYYGQTVKLTDPNDGFSIWNRWLGKDRYSTPSFLDSSSIQEMRQFFQAWTSTFRLPLLNKNNRNTSCIALLAEALPQAHFVIVRRDPQFVAQSLIRARKNIQGDKRSAWGLQSRSIRADQDSLGYIDDICDQLNDIESKLQIQLKGVHSGRVLSVQYEAFCREPAKFLETLHQSIPEVQLRRSVIDRELIPFEIATKRIANDDELARIRQRLQANFADASLKQN